MAKISSIKTSFNSGELSPKMLGRVDVEHYKSGAEQIQNFVVTPYGGATRTPGTRFVGEVRDSDKAARLIPFEFSTSQTYILEFNDGKIRFYRNQGRIVEASVTITGATQANPGVITAVAHGYSNGDDVVISSVGGMTRLNGNVYRVAGATANTFQLTHPQTGSNIDTSAYAAYTSGGTVARIYEISQPYADADLKEIQFAQTADIMYLVHEDYSPRKLSRTGHTAWTLQTVTFVDGPFLPQNTTATTLTPSVSAVDATGTLTASTPIFTSAADDPTTNIIGQLFKLHDGVVKVTDFTSTTVLQITVVSTLSATTATAIWSEGAWSPGNGNPQAVSFYEQRLGFAGSTNNPQTVWLSVSESYEDMDVDSAAADDALIYTIATDKVNAIRWLSAAKVLLLGTSGGVFSLSSGDDAIPLTPTNVVVKRETNFGVAPLVPQEAGSQIFYVQRDTLIVRELAYSLDIDQRKAINITILSDHITAGGIVDLDYQTSPMGLLWCVRGDGKMAVLTREIDQQVAGWAEQTPLGAGTGGDEFKVDAEGALSTSLIAYWKLQEASGTREDSKGSNDLTDNNTVTQVAGKVSQAAQFTLANSEYLSIADNSALSMGDIDFSMCAWVYLDSKPADKMRIICKGDTGDAANIEYGLRWNDTLDRFEFQVSDGTTLSELAANSFGAPSLATWYFVVAWHDASANTINIQVNGGTVDSVSHTPGVQDGAKDFQLGRLDATGAQYWNGRIDEVGIWKKVLTAQERSDLYNVGDGNTYLPASLSGFKNVAVISSQTATDGDEVWVVVSRVINDVTAQYVEFFEAFDWGSDDKDAFFVHSGLTYDGAAASSLIGLDHLEGEAVDVYGDGVVFDQALVTNGAITTKLAGVTTTVTKAQVGIPYTSTLKLLRLDPGSSIGTAQGFLKRINNVIARLLDTLQIKIGDATTQYDQDLAAMTTDDVEAHHDGGWDTKGQIVIKCDQPVPCHLLAVMTQVEVSER